MKNQISNKKLLIVYAGTLLFPILFFCIFLFAKEAMAFSEPLTFYGMSAGSTNHGASAVPSYVANYPGSMYSNGVYSGAPVYYTAQSTIPGYVGATTRNKDNMTPVPQITNVSDVLANNNQTQKKVDVNDQKIVKKVAIVKTTKTSKPISNKEVACANTDVVLIKGTKAVASVEMSFPDYIKDKIINFWSSLF